MRTVPGGDLKSMARTRRSLLRVRVPPNRRAEDLVRYLDARELDAAKAPEDETVLLHVGSEPEQSRLAVVVALEAWAATRRAEPVVVDAGGAEHVVRPHPDAAAEPW